MARVSRPPAQLLVDWTRCDGHGLCAALLPEAVVLDDWGFPLVDADRVGRQPKAALDRAVANCPALALRRG